MAGPLECRPAWDERLRLAALESYAILDTGREAAFDDIAELAADILEAPIAVVNFIASDRQWFKAEKGIGTDSLPLDVSICQHALLQPGIFVVPDLTTDARFSSNPLVTTIDGLRFYAGALLETPEGLPLGTVCVLDTKPRPEGINARQKRALQTLATQTMAQLELRRLAVAARYENEHLSAILAQATVGISELGLDARFISVNGRLCEMLGRSRDELLTLAMSDVTLADDVAANLAAFMRVATSGESLAIDKRYVRPDGEIVWANSSITPLLDDHGKPRRVLAVTVDITERVTAELIAAEHGKLLEMISTGAPVGDSLTEITAAIARLSPGVRACVLVPDAAREVFQVVYSANMPAGFRQQIEGAIDAVAIETCGEPVCLSEPISCPDVAGDTVRSPAWRAFCLVHDIAAVHSQPAISAGNAYVASVALYLREAREFTRHERQVALFGARIAAIALERHHAEAALRDSEERYRLIVESAQDFAIVALDEAGIITGWNRGAKALMGYTREEAVGQPGAIIFTPEDVAAGKPDAEMRNADAQGRAENERWHMRKDGSRFWGSGLVRPLANDDRRGYVKIFRDRTAKREAENEAARLATIVEQSRDFIGVADLDGYPVFLNEAGLAMMGFSSLLEARSVQLFDFLAEPDRARIRDVALPIAQRDGYWEGEVAFRRADTGREFPVRFNIFPVQDRSGQVTSYATVTRDLSEAKDAQAALLDSRLRLAEREERLRLAVENAEVGFWDVDLVNDTLVWPARTKAMFGISADVPVTMRDFFGGLHPDDREPVSNAYGAAADPAIRALYDVEFRTVGREDGIVRWLAAKGRGVFDDDGQCLRVIGTVLDITVRKQTDEALLELNETLEKRVVIEVARRIRTEEALRQAQKMEAMGQLTGGVAHDFNNLLTPIIGSLDMLQRRGLGGEREQRLIAGAAQSAERAKTLVQRLLAFARRQPLQAVAVDIAKLVTGMGELVASTTGPQIKVVVEASENLPPANADANQLEMALLNLAVNARDAMPNGGTLRISAEAEVVTSGHRSGLGPGTYVRLSVADTGTGMDEATAARAIEPFFSTKGIGQGTGLGLSMVHGLASQLNGALAIHSKVGLGTNIEFWLPVSDGLPVLAPPAPEAPKSAEMLGLALLVDDEALVRLSTADMLSDIGYTVVEAASGEEALRLIAQGQIFNLLVTDHLMPGMTGIDLAYAVRTISPGMPVLLVSGYAQTEGVDPGITRLTKPFRKDQLVASLGDLAPGRRDIA